MVDERKLPSSLKLKMPEFLNFVENFRAILAAKGFISKKVWEKRDMKSVTEMLSSFLYNVLQDNADLIRQFE